MQELVRRRDRLFEWTAHLLQQQPPLVDVVEPVGRLSGPDRQPSSIEFDQDCLFFRWRVTNKVTACGVYGSKTFGEDLFVTAQKHHNVVDAKTVLFLSDGDPVLESIRRDHFPQAPHQIDLRHVTEKVRRAYGWDRIEDAKKVLGYIFAGDRDSYEKQSIFDRLRFSERRSKIDEAREYVEGHWDELFTYRELKRRNPELPPHMNGTGAMERNIGTVVGHRMKHRGMGWTRKGAANIMRVRLEMVVPRTS